MLRLFSCRNDMKQQQQKKNLSSFTYYGTTLCDLAGEKSKNKKYVVYCPCWSHYTELWIVEIAGSSSSWTCKSLCGRQTMT